MLRTANRKPQPEYRDRITGWVPSILCWVGAVILHLMVGCSDPAPAREPGRIELSVRSAVFDTSFVFPDSASIDLTGFASDTTWQDTITELDNGTIVTLRWHWTAGSFDTVMQYVRVDSGMRSYSVLRGDTVYHETTLLLPGTRIDTIRYLNDLLVLEAEWGGNVHSFRLDRRSVFTGTLRRLRGSLGKIPIPLFRTSWNNRWLVWILPLSLAESGNGGLHSIVIADLNTGEVQLMNRFVQVSPGSLVPVTDPTGTWLHTGVAVWRDPEHPVPIPGPLAIFHPDAFWTSDTSFLLVVPDPVRPRAVYLSLRDDHTVAILDSSMALTPFRNPFYLCADYNHDLVWLLSDSDSLQSFGFHPHVQRSEVMLQPVSTAEWDALMLPVLLFRGNLPSRKIKLDLRGGIAYFGVDS